MILDSRRIAVLMVLAMAAACPAVMTEQDKATTFQEANVAFSQANKALSDEADRLYEKAILGYKRLAEEGGIRNARLYTNLGNAYLLKDDIGDSVLWYRRALQLEPGNAEITRNLAFARSKRLDKVEPPAEKRVMQTLFFWHYDLAPRTRFVAACVSMGLMCILLAAAIVVGRRPYFTAGAVIAAILLVAMAGSLLAEQLNRTTEGVIVAAEVVARQGDDDKKYDPAFKEPLHAGTEFTVVERRPGWVRLELADSSRGWVPSETVELF